MRVELFVSPGCSSREETEKVLKEILLGMAPEAILETFVVDSPEKAKALRFPGSPTVRVDGRDIEPDADKSLNYGLG